MSIKIEVFNVQLIVKKINDVIPLMYKNYKNYNENLEYTKESNVQGYVMFENNVVISINDILFRDGLFLCRKCKGTYEKKNGNIILTLSTLHLLLYLTEIKIFYKQIYFNKYDIYVTFGKYEDFADFICEINRNVYQFLCFIKKKDEMIINKKYLLIDSGYIRKYYKKFNTSIIDPYICSLISSGVFVTKKRFDDKNLYINYNFSHKKCDIYIKFHN